MELTTIPYTIIIKLFFKFIVSTLKRLETLKLMLCFASHYRIVGIIVILASIVPSNVAN